MLVYQKWFTDTLHCTQRLFLQGKTHLELFLKSSGVSEQMLLTELLNGSSEVTGIDLSHSTHQLFQDGTMNEDVLSLVCKCEIVCLQVRKGVFSSINVSFFM